MTASKLADGLSGISRMREMALRPRKIATRSTISSQAIVFTDLEKQVEEAFSEGEINVTRLNEMSNEFSFQAQTTFQIKCPQKKKVIDLGMDGLRNKKMGSFCPKQPFRDQHHEKILNPPVRLHRLPGTPRPARRLRSTIRPAMKAKTKYFDIRGMALKSTLLTGNPYDDLAQLVDDYDELTRRVENKQTDGLHEQIREQKYQEGVQAIEEFDVAFDHRNLALLLMRDGELYRGKFKNFTEFAKKKANLSYPQATKCCSYAALLFLYEKRGQLHLCPRGRAADKVITLPPQHWLPAWDHVLESADPGQLSLKKIDLLIGEYRKARGLDEKHPRKAIREVLFPDAEGTLPSPRKKKRPSKVTNSLPAELASLIDEMLPADQLKDLLGKHCRTSTDCVVRSLKLRGKQLKVEHPGRLVRLLQELRTAEPDAADVLEELLYVLCGQVLLTECSRRERDCRQKRAAYRGRTHRAGTGPKTQTRMVAAAGEG